MRVDDFIEATNAAATPEEVFRLFRRAIAAYGFDRTIYCGIGAGEAPAIISNYPHDWLAYYEARGYVRTDPARLQCAIARRPFLWAEVAHRLPRDRNRIFHEATEAGVRDGIGIPIHQPSGQTMGIALASSSGHTEAAVHLAHLHLLALQFHQAYSSRLALPDYAAPVRLSPREAEVLKWMSQGKSKWVIGEILGISEHTVSFHCRNIFRKLGVSNGRLAVLKAIQLNLIPF